MSFPPQPPTGPPPGWGPPPTPPSGPTQAPPGHPPQGPPGFGPPQGPYGGQYGAPFGGPPRKSRVGLIVGAVALVVALIVGIAITTIVLIGKDDDGDQKAGRDRTDESSTSPTDSTSAPSESTTSPGTATPYVPSENPDDDIHTEIKTTDFTGDWNFKLGDVKHSAKFLKSWDYDTCGPVEDKAILTTQRCEYAVQWIYSALGGKARVTHIYMAFDNQRHATAAEAKLQDEDFDLRDGSTFPGYTVGKWTSGVYGNLVGITVGTAKGNVDADNLQSLVNYLNTDYKVALQLRSP